MIQVQQSYPTHTSLTHPRYLKAYIETQPMILYGTRVNNNIE